MIQTNLFIIVVEADRSNINADKGKSKSKHNGIKVQNVDEARSDDQI